MRGTEQARTSGFVVCVNNEGYEIDLLLTKRYEVVPDESLEPEDIRVIDESGEDYIYPASFFSPTGGDQETMQPPETDFHSAIARQIRGFIEENEPLLSEGSATVLGRV